MYNATLSFTLFSGQPGCEISVSSLTTALQPPGHPVHPFSVSSSNQEAAESGKKLPPQLPAPALLECEEEVGHSLVSIIIEIALVEDI